MSQAAKEVTAGWNFKAFILIRMGLHPCTIYSWYSKKSLSQNQKFKKKKKFKKHFFNARGLTLPHLPYMGRVCPVPKPYMDTPWEKEELFNLQIQKKIDFFHLSFLQRLSATFQCLFAPETKCYIVTWEMKNNKKK